MRIDRIRGRNPKLRRILALATAALVPIALATAATTAEAATGNSIDNQEALSTYRTWMSGQPGYATGYVGAIDDLAHKATTILWYGPRTAALTAIVQEGQRRGISVSVQQRSHSLQQIDSAFARIWAQAAAGEWAGFSISALAGVGATDDGITVYGTYTGTSRAPQVAAPATDVLGIPVHVVPGVAAGTSNGRDNDFSPFDAGGYMISPSTGHTCSTGFAITLNGTARITTARHCTANDYRDRAASNTYGTGVVNSGDGGGRVLSAAGTALALDGPYNSDGFTKTVIGYEDLGINNFVCTGGGNSGEHCNVKVTNLRVSFNDGIGTFSTIEGVQQTSGQIAQIQGDSGGPVISLASTSSGQVRAAGMIQGFLGSGSTGAACGPVFDAGSNKCTTNVLFSSMRTVVNSISGASLRTA